LPEFQGVKNVECGVAGDHVVSGTHDLYTDPGLTGPLSGPAWGMRPGPDSPAIDAGDNEVCPHDDILGKLRPADGDGEGGATCDMGAFE